MTLKVWDTCRSGFCLWLAYLLTVAATGVLVKEAEKIDDFGIKVDCVYLVNMLNLTLTF